MPYVRPEPFRVAAAQLSPVFLDRYARPDVSRFEAPRVERRA